MTLDEAITLCSEVIGEKYLDGHVKCASNHEQFKEWLEELKHITNPQPYKFIVSGEAVEKEITRLIEYRVKKDILVPKKIKNGLMKLVKIKKGKLYKWDYLINNGYIFLAKEITSKDNIRSYKDVIKLKKDDLEKYFERCKV